MDLGSVSSYIVLSLSVVLFGVKAFALADCIGRKPADFTMIETLPKRGWLLVLGLALAVHLLDWYPVGILNLVGTVAAFVYLVQLRGNR